MRDVTIRIVYSLSQTIALTILDKSIPVTLIVAAPEFALVIGLMIRYLFVFAEMFGRVMNVFETKCFNSFDRSLPYKYRLKILGYTVGTMFIRSYEQGERTYISMLCRGYSKDSYLHVSKKEIKPAEWIIVCIALMFIIMVPLVGYFSGV